MSEILDDETAPAYVVCVQSAAGDQETDWFWLEPGDDPVVESLEDRELIINKIPADSDNNEEEFVAIYGTDMWVRAWVAEYDPNAEPEDPDEVEE